MHSDKEFNEIFTLYYKRLFLFVHQFIDDEEECHDIAEDCFEYLWKNFDKVEREAAPAYLFRIARSKTADFFRKHHKHEKYIQFVNHLTQEYTDAQKLIEKEEQQKHVDFLINQLKPPTRDIFIACYVDRNKYKEVAEKMGISTSTVKKHIIKALKIIKSKNHAQKHGEND